MVRARQFPSRSFVLSLILCAAGCGEPLAPTEPVAQEVLSAQGAEQAFGDAVRGLCRLAVGETTDWVVAPPPATAPSPRR